MTQERQELRPTPPGEGLSTPPPELRVTQLIRSAEPVIKSDSRIELKPSRSNSLVEPYGDYTLVVGRGFNEVQILDNQGRKVERLDNNSTMVVNWPALGKRSVSGNYSGFAIDATQIGYGRQDYKQVKDLPEELQPFITKYIENTKGRNTVPIPISPWQLLPDKTDQMATTTGDGYIVLHNQDSGIFVAFQTKTPQGVDLPPRNWKRFDNKDH